MLFKSQKKKGVTLLEVIISIAILALLIIPIGNLVLGTSSTNKKAQDKQRASLMGQSVLEQLCNVDDSKHTRSTVELKYTDMMGASKDGNTDSDARVKLQNGNTNIDTGNGKYSASVSIEKILENKDAEDLRIGVSTGDSFEANYKSAAYALEIVKENDSSVSFLDPISNNYTTSSSNQKYVIYVDDDASVKLYRTNLDDLNDFPNDSDYLKTLGNLSSATNGDIRILLVGDRYIKSSSVILDSYDKPFDFLMKVGFVSNYDRDFNVSVTKGKNVSGSITMNSAVKTVSSVKCQVYQSPTDLNSDIGDLYRVTVTVKNSKTGDTIFESSSTCNYIS